MTPTQRKAMQQALEALELNCASQTESPATKAMQALRAALAEPTYPLPDDLYPGSKDWAHGTYADRVEWLHTMYESAKNTMDALAEPQQAAEPCTPDWTNYRQGLADGWAEGYEQGVKDERTSEDNIGIAGFGAKVDPARQNPYGKPQPAEHEPVASDDAGIYEFWARDKEAEQPKPAKPAEQEPVALGPLAKRRVFDYIRGAYDLGYNDARNARAIPGDNAPGYKGRDVEADHGGALFNALRACITAPQPAKRVPLTLDQLADLMPPDNTPMSLGEAFVKFARAIERAHGIGGQP